MHYVKRYLTKKFMMDCTHNTQGVNGYYDMFFKKAWPVIKHDVCDAIREVFSTGELYQAVNCTAITLLPLSTKNINIAQWQPLTDKIVAKISSWTAKKLSYAGMQLVRTVIFGIQAYWAQMFVLPAKVMKLIQAYCRSYIWSGMNVITKKALVAWEKMCTPKAA